MRLQVAIVSLTPWQLAAFFLPSLRFGEDTTKVLPANIHQHPHYMKSKALYVKGGIERRRGFVRYVDGLGSVPGVVHAVTYARLRRQSSNVSQAL